MDTHVHPLLRWLIRVEDIGRIITIISMTAIVFIQVVARVFFKWSSPAMEEAARFIMIWSIFIGAVVTTREDGHIKMGGIFRSGRGQMWFEVLSKLVTILFLIVFVKWSYEYAAHSMRRSMNSIVLGVPLVVVHVCFLVTGLLMLFHTTVHFVDRVRKVFVKDEGGRR